MLNPELLPRICQVHRQAMSDDDMSVMLGPAAIKTFYEELIHSPHAHCFVVLVGEEVAGLSTVFTDYPAFMSKLKRRLLPQLIRAALNPVKLKKIFRSFRTKNPIPKERQKAHLGMIIRNPKVDTFQGIRAFSNAYNESIKFMEDKGVTSIWASTRKANKDAVRFLVNQGFQTVNTSQSIVFFEKPMRTASNGY